MTQSYLTFPVLQMRKLSVQEIILLQRQFQERNIGLQIPSHSPHPPPAPLPQFPQPSHPQDSAFRGGDLPGGPAHPQPAPEHGDLAPRLLLALPPLHQVQAVVDGQRDVPLTHSGVDSARQQVGLSLQCHLHAVGQQQPQGAICPDVVAVPDLV